MAEGDVIEPSANSVELHESVIALEHGVPSYTIKREVFKKYSKNDDEAFHYKGQIFFCEGMSNDNKGIAAPHEIEHVMRYMRFEPYIVFLQNARTAFNNSSWDTLYLVERVLKHINYSREIYSNPSNQVV